jgi:cysteine protease ATG4
MNATDIERCRKRIIQYLWDPEPKNDEDPGSPIWCLGTCYAPLQHNGAVDDQIGRFKEEVKNRWLSLLTHPVHDDGRLPATASVNGNDWPEAFLSDFESKIWMTYRSSFTPIPKDPTRDGSTSLTLSVRLRSQVLESQGFTADTGWGCMIRSGQSLLANAMAILSLGRGMFQWAPMQPIQNTIGPTQTSADTADRLAPR